MRIALIAHDKKKDDLIQFVTAYRDTLLKHDLYATGTTGSRIENEVGVSIHKFKSGPLGGTNRLVQQ